MMQANASSQHLSLGQRFTEWNRNRKLKNLKKRCRRQWYMLFEFSELTTMEGLVRPLPSHFRLAEILKLGGEGESTTYYFVYDVANKVWGVRVDLKSLGRSVLPPLSYSDWIEESNDEFLVHLKRVSAKDLKLAIANRER